VLVLLGTAGRLSYSYTCIINAMSRKPVSRADREHGRRLGQLIAAGRRERQQSAPDLALESRVAIDTVRSLENGRVATPTFLTIARLAGVLGMSLDEMHGLAMRETGPGGRPAQ
jgi:ribosome-binding protein aMBF1 (putative translation factor)